MDDNPESTTTSEKMGEIDFTATMFCLRFASNGMNLRIGDDFWRVEF